MVCALWSLSPNKERNEAHALFAAIRKGDVGGVRNVAEQHPHLLNEARSLRRLTPLHLAASIGQLEVLIALLERGADAEPLDRYGKTPLMLACKQKKWACAEWLLDRAGANIIVFGSSRGRTCLHYAAKGGNSSCVQKILAAADSSTWGLARFLNAQDRSGITALHLASLSGHAAVVQELLSNGALVSARTIPYGQINELGGGMSPLHAAARGGSVECVQALLSWGADRRHRDNEGFTAYGVANEYHNFACAALLNPNAAEPLVWPSSLKFIKELEPEAKKLLEAALREANRRHHRQQHRPRKQNQQERDLSQELAASGSSSIKDEDVCCICFDHLCTIQVKDCGHQMCATCALKLCCHGSSSSSSSPPGALACPFCRQDIASLVLAPSSISHGCRDEQQQVHHQSSSSSSRRSRRVKPLSPSVSVVLRQLSHEEMEGGDAPPPPNSSGLNKGKEVSIRWV
ncbi:E3 ubiquitin-protein ligase XB3 isoform X1 [Selaginella moellendorffii]|uniref:E3 ubiquitin-protein ligase XB3 isoform X1 n=1 Tax=Selaginella moellendorffii TaxID=88036 RepID=UPI000D1D0520|nr:E3 ubiquitin-protein ligase XB3 isoform X1 [Selaginella moellendorffii]|eukprot:XP_024532718.1 E3 ubiquitin-protein ligase XB3 isoform X1 [Selaginella moellendorffii]